MIGLMNWKVYGRKRINLRYFPGTFLVEQKPVITAGFQTVI
jgi:hypothetical protein